jgi:hypothetical protein
VTAERRGYPASVVLHALRCGAMRQTGFSPELDQRVPGAALSRLKAIGIARVPSTKDERFADTDPPMEVLRLLAAGLRAYRPGITSGTPIEEI